MLTSSGASISTRVHILASAGASMRAHMLASSGASMRAHMRTSAGASCMCTSEYMLTPTVYLSFSLFY